MKKISLIIFTFCLCLNGNLFSQKEICYDADNNFVVGERLTYKVFYNWGFVWVPAGEVVFEISETNKNLLFEIFGTSYPSYDSFFKVRDHYKSVVDKQTGKPICYSRSVQEGNYVCYDSISINHKEDQLMFYRGESKSNCKEHLHELDRCLFDIVSATYNLRNQSKESIQSGLDVNVFFGNKKYKIAVDHEGHTEKKVKDLGKIKAFKVSPQLIVGSVFKENDKMNIWVSDDQNKIPVLVESPIFVGSIKAVLKSFDNLKYPSIIP